MNSCPVCAASGAAAPCPLAAEWVDEERMEFLTSHVAPGDLNARADLISFWSKAVAHACEQAPSLSVDPAVLARTSLDWGGATAPGLELAIEHMLSAGTLVDRSKIEEQEAGLARRLVFAPLLYLVEAVGLGIMTGRTTPSQYVNRDVIEALAEGVVAYCQHLPPEERTVYLPAAGHSKSLGQPAGDTSPWCFEQLCRAAAGGGASGTTGTGGLAPPPPNSDAASRMLSRLSRDDLALLARHLVRTKRAVEEEGLLKTVARGGGGGGVGGQGVRRAAAAGEISTVISETEKDLLRLRCTVASLEASASDLGKRIQRARQDALRERRTGQKRAALVHLGRMKQFQAARDKRLSSLYTLQTALDQVKQLRMDRQVLEAHEAATSALKTCREVQGLTVERVEDTLGALAEEMTEHQAIGAALARDDALCGQNGMGEIEAAELEAELDAILRAERALQGALRGPTVPASAGASPTTAASASAVGGAVVGRPAAPARPTASTPSPSMTGAVPERRAVREPA